MKSKYSILLKILDDICQSAPLKYGVYQTQSSSANYSDALIAARSRALLHLYLMVECGCDEEDFNAREEYICEGTNDGGLDAYYIDNEKRKIVLIQSKFRATASNFQDVSIKADDLIKTDFERITQGQPTNSQGVKFNNQVLKFQKKLQKVSIGKYEYLVVILANLKHYSPPQIKRLIGSHKYEIFDADKVYNQLVFPVCQGTYYNPSEISIKVKLAENKAPRLQQTIRTSAGDCNILIIYVPAIEVGKILLKYKNAILEYNPRNYLSLKDSTESVNAQIALSVTKIPANDFAILNNGITLIADDSSVTDESGKRNVGVLSIVNPQIINGGQTAYTLSQLYSDLPNAPAAFKGKEVMLKIVTLQAKGEKRQEFISSISSATNQQNPVEVADRRSNSPVLTELQQKIFNEYGYFFERKKGEFFNGKLKGFMAGQHQIDRVDLIRSWYSYVGEPASARSGKDSLFEEERLKKILPDASRYKEVFLAYMLLLELVEKQKQANKGVISQDGSSNVFRYGKYVPIAAAAHLTPSLTADIGVEDFKRIATNLILKVIGRWKDFEKHAVSKQPQNIKYFSGGVEHYDNYYKGKTVNGDIAEYFSNISI